MRNRIRATVLTVAVTGLIGAGILTATTASAHSATPHTASVCNNNGTWSGEFSATNDYTLTATMSGTGTGLDGGYAKTGQPGSSRTVTVTAPVSQTTIPFPGTPGKMVWSDGFTHTGITWPTAHLPEGCRAPDVLDATATVTVTPGTCTTPGSASYTATFAYNVGDFSTAPGHHDQTFAAVEGHRFADGSTTLVLPYDVPGRDRGLCIHLDASLRFHKGTGCAPSRRFVQITHRAHMATVRVTHTHHRTVWHVTGTTQPGHRMHAHRDGTGHWTSSVNWLVPVRAPGSCGPHPHGS